jgi:CBS domain-containing protein
VLVGMLSRADLIAGLGSGGRDALVSAHVRRRCTPADPDEPLEPVLARLQSEPCRTLPVLAGGALVGLLTLENVGELLMVQASERKTRSGTRTSPLVPALVGMLAMLTLAGRQPAQTFTGTISDSVCALSHAPMRMGPTDAECTHACIEEHGASYVLVTGTDVYQLSDQRAPKAFAGKPVKVVGTLDAASRTITVVSISGG